MAKARARKRRGASAFPEPRRLADLPVMEGCRRRRCRPNPISWALVWLVACVAFAGKAATAPEAEVPRQQLHRRVLRADPGQEYFLYVPGTGGQEAALFVAVHGDSRNSETHATTFAGYCESYGVVLVAPHFDEDRYPDYQRLGRAGLGERADLVLDAIVSEVAALTGADTAQLYLFGFSGGAQFAHRYVLAHPQRVARAAVVAAGWYTFPDPKVEFPYGTGPSAGLPDVRFVPEAFLGVPIAVLVGERDTGHKNLRHNVQVDAQQGRTRIERAQRWVAAMGAAATAHGLPSQVSFELVAGMDHSFKRFMQEGRLGDKVFAHLFGPPGHTLPAPGARAPGEALQPVGGAR